MKRVYLCVAAFAALGLAVTVTGASAQQPAAGGAPAPATASRGTAVFNVAKVMKDYQKWQYFAEQMNKERTEKGAKLSKIRDAILDAETKYKAESSEVKKKEYEATAVALQRQFEDEERKIRKELDDRSMAHLRTLFAEIRTVVDAVAKSNGFELVLAYPSAITAEDMNSPVYIDMMMRTPAAMPFYVSPNIDVTKVVADTLNKHFPAPGPVTAAGATAPPAGGAAVPPPGGGMK